MKPICNAQNPKMPYIVVLDQVAAVRCMRDPNHRGMHVAAPLGKMITWIEPEKTRGAAKLDSDDAPVASPSDPRSANRPGKWARLVEWVKGLV